ncbi:protein kinase domain-containing protein [Nocardia sp. KC 131]|uniref:protein kinase domain-containing protein n=1 Tax=Nocardia arseniciresistens TaxID=3392119 RepID=UPI00398F178E
MTDDDPLRTHCEVATSVTAELAAAGFEDAVEIGRGGFGVVYRCTQAALDRTVAVKVLTAQWNEDNQARFVREQHAMGRLTGHPNIVTVLEAGTTEGGRPYLVMPYYPLDSVDGWIRKNGALPLDRVLHFGVEISDALESAHRLGIVHRDVKPGNILLTEYGEPALTDFGVAHIAGGFRTTVGVVTGSPAFTAPEVLEGDDPTSAADVYGLGATLFCALTGHAAFQRRSGENVVAQFVRITTQPMPDLQGSGIPEDVSALVETAMSRDPHERPSAAGLGESIRQAQQRHGFSVGETGRQSDSILERRHRDPPTRGRRPLPAAGAMDSGGNLAFELTSFVGRRTELSAVKNLLATSRLVTFTGVGGVGKTRLALRAASQAQRDFADGVWLVELAAVSDAALLVDVVAATLGLRDEAPGRLREVLVKFLGSREILLVLDNCEHMVEAVAKLSEALLRTCPDLRILATSREALNIAGEAVLRVAPLTVQDQDQDQEPTLTGLPRFEAVTLFADRAAAAVPDFELDENNKAAVTRICARLDGLPLAIELAAARMRAMSPEQILQRLDDRYALLTRGSRTAPTRQQTLRWCVDWGYELCTPAEQRLWARLSVFAVSCELDAVEQVCGVGLAPHSPLDVLSSLVDKSILIREESHTIVRFRMLETMRDYGWQRLRESGEDTELRRRHRDWYQQLALDAQAGWISDRQPYWIARLERELPNLRDALESCLSEDTDEAAEAGLRTAAALHEFWGLRGMYGEGRAWLDRVLAHPGAQSIPDRIGALRAACEVAAPQGDFRAAAALLEQGRLLAQQASTPAIQGQLAYAAGITALASGAAADASSALERAVELLGSNQTEELYISALTILAWSYELRGQMTRATEHYRRVLSITEEQSEFLYRSAALRGLGVSAWLEGERDRAQQLLEAALRINRRPNSPVFTAFSIEALAWTTADQGNAERAAVLLGAAQGKWLVGNSVRAVLRNMSRFHEECEQTTRRTLGARRFDGALRQGQVMGMDAAIAYALGEQPTDAAPASGASAKLTKREQQVADLVAQGFSNKQIAAELVIAQRTAEGHVEHILTKLGFNSRAQIAAWTVDQTKH